MQDTLLLPSGHARRQYLSQDAEGFKSAWQDPAVLASGEYPGSQDLYQDSGALTTAWHDLYQVSVGYMIGLDHHKDSVGYHATSQGLCQVTLGVLLDQASQGAIYQVGHDGGDYLAARAALYLSSIGKPGTVTQGPNQAISDEMEIESQYVFNQAVLKIGEYPAEAAHYQASDGEPDAAAGPGPILGFDHRGRWFNLINIGNLPRAPQCKLFIAFLSYNFFKCRKRRRK